MTQAAKESPTATREVIRTERLLAGAHVRPNVPLALLGAALASTIILLPFANLLLTLATYVGARKRTRLVGEAAVKALRAFVGSEPRFLDAGCSGFSANLNVMSGSGIAYADGRLFVMEEGRAAEIPWSQVRSWSWDIQGWQTEAGGADYAPDTPMCLVHKTQGPRIVAHRASGFTIVTRDIEKTTWRFTTINRALCTKWMEILRQMDEGELPAR